ncbi:MAG: Bacterial regulatory protein luxR family [Frankiales bacterium]|nr:Bacterial regulatory protein luxR family [Frankiales bacterium]
MTSMPTRHHDPLQQAILDAADEHQLPITVKQTAALTKSVTAALALRTPAPRPGCPLTAKQLDIVRMLANGLRDAEIAVYAGVTRGAVRSHIGNATGRLGAGSRTHAVALCVAAGWVEVPDAGAVRRAAWRVP